MRRFVIAAGVALLASVAEAHVTVVPRESHAGMEQSYTIRVPTEGQIATTSVELEIPAGVIVSEVVQGDGYSVDVRREGGRIVAITWKRDIAPKQVAEFAFVARNPTATEVSWKAHQRFADGTTTHWVGVPGDRQPASVTKLLAR